MQSPRIETLEREFSEFSDSIKHSINKMSGQIEVGRKTLESKMDNLSEKIGKNNQDIDKIKTEKKIRAKIIAWIFEVLKQFLAIIISVMTIYFFLKYGGKVL